MKKIQHFLWWCAGARIDLLELEECKSDHAKYFGIGGTIFFTALMASFAGGYAFFTAFKNVPLSIFFGAFWGSLIFNLDRYIVATIKDDGKATISRTELLNASPRLLMAVLIGFVIATPLELKIFEREIGTIVERLKIERAEEIKGRDASFNSDLADKKNRHSTISSDIINYTNNKKKLLDNAVSFIEERRNTLLKDSQQKGFELTEAQNKFNTANANYLVAFRDSTGKFTEGQIDKFKEFRDKALSVRNKISTEKAEIDKHINSLESDKETAIREEAGKIDKQINSLMTEKELLIASIKEMDVTKQGKDKNINKIVETYDGFAAHMHALDTLANEQPIIYWARLLLTLLFIFIEVAPVLFKLMTEFGPYDEVLNRNKHTVIASQRKIISDLNDEINTNIAISTQMNQARLEASLKENNQIFEAIVNAQAEIATKAIEKWKKHEIKKLDKSISHIVNTEPQPENKVV